VRSGGSGCGDQVSAGGRPGSGEAGTAVLLEGGGPEGEDGPSDRQVGSQGGAADLEVERLQERLGQLQTVQDKLELSVSEKRKEHEKALLDMDMQEEQKMSQMTEQYDSATFNLKESQSIDICVQPEFFQLEDGHTGLLLLIRKKTRRARSGEDEAQALKAASGTDANGSTVAYTDLAQTHVVGDLRVAHFVGMHALQLLPVLLLGIRRLRGTHDDAVERTALVVAAIVALGTFLALLLQALNGQPLIPLPSPVPGSP
jgi:hypothetical protein